MGNISSSNSIGSRAVAEAATEAAARRPLSASGRRCCARKQELKAIQWAATDRDGCSATVGCLRCLLLLVLLLVLLMLPAWAAVQSFAFPGTKRSTSFPGPGHGRSESQVLWCFSRVGIYARRCRALSTRFSFSFFAAAGEMRCRHGQTWSKGRLRVLAPKRPVQHRGPKAEACAH